MTSQDFKGGLFWGWTCSWLLPCSEHPLRANPHARASKFWVSPHCTSLSEGKGVSEKWIQNPICNQQLYFKENFFLQNEKIENKRLQSREEINEENRTDATGHTSGSGGGFGITLKQRYRAQHLESRAAGRLCQHRGALGPAWHSRRRQQQPPLGTQSPPSSDAGGGCTGEGRTPPPPGYY